MLVLVEPVDEAREVDGGQLRGRYQGLDVGAGCGGAAAGWRHGRQLLSFLASFVWRLDGLAAWLLPALAGRHALPYLAQAGLDDCCSASGSDIQLICLDPIQLVVSQLLTELLKVFKLITEDPGACDPLHWHQQLFYLLNRYQLTASFVSGGEIHVESVSFLGSVHVAQVLILLRRHQQPRLFL